MVSRGNLIPSSRVCVIKVAMVYRFGFSTGSTPSFDRRNNGVDADMKVGTIAFRTVTGAIESGRVQEFNDPSVERMDRGGCVDGVNMSFVRAISNGARTVPAIPAADTATTREVRGEGEDRISRPPVNIDCEKGWNERPGSGRARRAEINDLVKEVIVDESIAST